MDVLKVDLRVSTGKAVVDFGVGERLDSNLSCRGGYAGVDTCWASCGEDLTCALFLPCLPVPGEIHPPVMFPDSQ